MRLIDADALIDKLVISHTAHSQNAREASLLNRDVRMVIEAPTAYDVEKVVAELKDKKYEAGIIAGIRGTKFGEDEYEEEPYHEGKKHAYGNAIEIVKRGGVE